MSYEPLHHKYRPQTFAEVVGQDAIATTLTRAVDTRRIAHAYLFTGSRGTGKTSTARILAKSLNCLASDQPTSKPCGVCEACRAIAQGSSLDVIEIDAASNTGVDNIREIIERAQFAPVQCRYKLYLIDEVHMLSVAAFNALLKTLEEPPARVVFVLATTDPQRVLPTIISRCQRFDFRRIPLEAMVSHLQGISAKENIDITEEAITLVAQIANGGLRDAESLLDQLSLLSGTVNIERVWDLVGAIPENDLLALLRAIDASDPEAVLQQCRNLMDRGREPLVVLQNLAGFYRDLLIAKTAPNRPDMVAVTSPTWKQLCEEASHWDNERILQNQKHLKDSEVQLKNTTQPRLWLEVTLFGLLPAAHSVQLEPTKAEGEEEAGMRGRGDVVKITEHHNSPPQEGSDSPHSSPLTPHSALPQQPAAETPNTSTTTDSEQGEAEASKVPAVESCSNSEQTPPHLWQQVLEQIQPPATQALVSQHCHLKSYEGSHAYIDVRNKNLLKMAQDKKPNIKSAFEAVCQQKISVSLQVATQGGVESTPPPGDKSQNNTPPKPQETPQPAQFNQQSSTLSEASSEATPQQEIASPSNQATIQTNPSVEDVTPSASPYLANASPTPVKESHQANPQNRDDEAQNDLTSAAQSLAKFFQGELVTLNDERLEVNEQTAPQQSENSADTTAEMQQAQEVNPDDDEDIPF